MKCSTINLKSKKVLKYLRDFQPNTDNISECTHANWKFKLITIVNILFNDILILLCLCSNCICLRSKIGRIILNESRLKQEVFLILVYTHKQISNIITFKNDIILLSEHRFTFGLPEWLHMRVDLNQLPERNCIDLESKRQKRTMHAI